jgi:N-succinyldiaminopimelate aminotransferase
MGRTGCVGRRNRPGQKGTTARMYNSRLDGLTDYPFQRLAALLADVTPPADVTPIAMSIGEPQHATPDLIHAALADHAAEWNKYPPTAGTQAYRSAVAAWLTARYSLPETLIDPDKNTLPVAGTREALFMAAQLVVPPAKAGQTPAVLMPNPFYQVYLGAAVMAGAEPVLVAATNDTGFLPDFASVGPSLLDRTALAYLCSPANPQGAVASLEQLTTAIILARKHDFVLVGDECYSEIYDDTPPPGLLEACQALGGDLSNVLVFNSLSKRSSAPGLRAGFVAGDPDLIDKFQRLRSHAGAVQPLPVMAAATALWRDEMHVVANRNLYRQKFEDAERIFGNRFGFAKPAGGFFQWLDVGDGCATTRALWRDGGIKVLPGAYLARPDANGVNPGDRYIRVALVHDRDTTASALTRMFKILSEEV